MRKNKQGNTKIVVLLILLILLVGGFYFYNKREAKAPSHEDQVATTTQSSQQTTEQQATQTPSTQTPVKGSTKDYSPGTFSSGEDQMMGSDIAVEAVTYDGSAFVPERVDIKANDYIFFKNTGAQAVVLTGTEGTKQAIKAGATYKKQFSQSGEFSFFVDGNGSSKVLVNVTK